MPPHKNDMTYIVVEDFGHLGRAYLETDEQPMSRDTLIDHLIDMQSDCPVRVVAFDAKACDVSADIAQGIIERARICGIELMPKLISFCEANPTRAQAVARKKKTAIKKTAVARTKRRVAA